MRYIWYEEYDNEYHYPDHNHNFYEMAYYPVGTGLLNADGNDYPIGDGYFAIVPPGMKHCETQHLEAKKICFAFYSDENIPFLYRKDISQKVHRVLKEIYKESINLQFNSREYISAKLNEMFVYIERDTRTNIKSSDSNFIYIINNMDEKFNEKISLQKYAEQLNISYDYFRHKFKSITGVSPQEYIVNKRLEAALNLISTTNLSCTEISEKCGFSDSAQFSKMFKEKYKISPRKYRNI